MISKELAIALAIGTVLMAVPVAIQSRWYQVKIWKSMLATVLLTVVGTTGTYLLFFVENGRWGGISFYGAVFLVPILFALLAWILRLSYGTLMDLCATAECMMLAFMKIQCLTSGCCGGRVLFSTADGNAVVFPSQIVELVNGLVLMGVMMYLARKRPNRGDLYPWYMVLYGCTRFVLNTLRGSLSPLVLGMPPGHFWSLVSILLGVTVLLILRKKETSRQTR